MGWMLRALCAAEPRPLPADDSDRPTGLNERIAVFATRRFGTMTTTYIFAVYGALPLVIGTSNSGTILFWSNWVQLFSLPLLMVGTAVMGRASERRAKETHEAIMDEMVLERQQLAQLTLIVDHLKINQTAEIQQLTDLTDTLVSMATPEQVQAHNE